VTFFTLHIYLVQFVIHNDFTFRCFVEIVSLTMDFKEVENRICVRRIIQREFTHHRKKVEQIITFKLNVYTELDFK